MRIEYNVCTFRLFILTNRMLDINLNPQFPPSWVPTRKCVFSGNSVMLPEIPRNPELQAIFSAWELGNYGADRAELLTGPWNTSSWVCTNLARFRWSRSCRMRSFVMCGHSNSPKVALLQPAEPKPVRRSGWTPPFSTCSLLGFGWDLRLLFLLVIISFPASFCFCFFFFFKF